MGCTLGVLGTKDPDENSNKMIDREQRTLQAVDKHIVKVLLLGEFDFLIRITPRFVGAKSVGLFAPWASASECSIFRFIPTFYK
jgi:hypothetical protein